jgi:transposase
MMGSTSFGAGRADVRIWLANEPLDMRRGFDRLAEHVRVILAQDPMSGHLFVFRNRSAERLKILWWDRDGYVIFYKRLERGTFQFPSAREKPGLNGVEGSVAIDSGRLMKLLAGCAIY